MDTPDTPTNASEIATLETRLTAISTAVRELFTSIVGVIHAEDAQKNSVEDASRAMGAALTLCEHALVSITETADATQRVAALMEREQVMAVEANEAAAREANEKSNPKRSFIGQKD